METKQFKTKQPYVMPVCDAVEAMNEGVMQIQTVKTGHGDETIDVGDDDDDTDGKGAKQRNIWDAWDD